MSDLAEQLRSLGLRHSADHFADFVALATKRRLGVVEILERIAELENTDRSRRSLERRLLRSRIGRFKPVSDFDWSWPTRVDRAAIEAALKLAFIEQARNLVLVAPQGLGKAMLAKNIAHAAIRVVPKLTRPERMPRRELLARVAVRAPHRVASSPEAAADVDALLVYGIENPGFLASVSDLHPGGIFWLDGLDGARAPVTWTPRLIPGHHRSFRRPHRPAPDPGLRTHYASRSRFQSYSASSPASNRPSSSSSSRT